ncbi:AraC family transcriptional regulator, carnitine catabolism transcriptional activator [Pseudomonas citronellolis]|uniref:AraC family transcriptional regulator, carnitine catabolism transcriptional activator n=1 Tax=Pseudomonas citronellolis TaxID=53408 RepID=A0AAQ1HQ76_9PSED|nr:GlxA family transcriptional regulator [Pseudomonas citronellolis]TGC22374.1 GlxA family transcriptional regulator [Pseudomonas citronellolis]SFD16078.1 AraC family transcriptional regulator, carnitine catabolism transcriptional activator [Pseudomonas citronellolis]
MTLTERADWPPLAREPQRIGILLLPCFSNFGLAALIEPLSIANWLAQRKLFDWTLLSLDGKPVPASNGLLAAAQQGIGEPGEFDVCAVIASFDVHRHARDAALKAWLKRQAAFGAVLMGIETGSELLAAAGVLDGHPAAVHWDNLQGFQESYPRVQTRAQLYSVGRKRLTCAGATAVLDMMLGWLEGVAGAGLAREVAMHMLVERVREPQVGQVTGFQHRLHAQAGRLGRAIALMEQHLEEPLSCEALAARVGLSRRQLERQFMQHTGLTPLKYYLALRLARAHNLLQQTRMSVAQVAASAGFGSLEHFSRAYRARFGCTPSSDRSQSLEAPVMRQPLAHDHLPAQLR